MKVDVKNEKETQWTQEKQHIYRIWLYANCHVQFVPFRMARNQATAQTPCILERPFLSLQMNDVINTAWLLRLETHHQKNEMEKKVVKSHVLAPQNEGMTILHIPKYATNQVSRFIEDIEQPAQPIPTRPITICSFHGMH